MSADNYGICPRCWNKARADHILLSETLEAAYGTLPLAAFDDLRAKVSKEVDEEDYRTLREYYEFYINHDTWEFSADYEGTCDVCQWSHSINHKEDLSTTA